MTLVATHKYLENEETREEEVLIVGFLGTDHKSFNCVCVNNKGELKAIPNYRLKIAGDQYEGQLEPSTTGTSGAV